MFIRSTLPLPVALWVAAAMMASLALGRTLGGAVGLTHLAVTTMPAYDSRSTWSSLLPLGNAASSSHHSSSHAPPTLAQLPQPHPVVSAGNHTRPACTRPAA